MSLERFFRLAFLLHFFAGSAWAQGGHPQAPPPPPNAKTVKCAGRPVPQLEDITAKTGIAFQHTADPSKKYIVESMSGGVILLDYDRDGWVDIYFTNAPTVAMAIKGQTSKGALYKNNGDGTFTDVTAKAGVADGRWSAGAAFGDYDGDSFVDLMVSNYVDFHLNDLPGFGSSPNCKYRSLDVQCGPRGLKGAGDSLFHNNGDGTFTDVSKFAGVSDPNGYYGMGVVWADFNNSGRPDIYVANDSTPSLLYRNLGNGKFQEIGLESGTAVSEDGSEQGSMGVAVGDYNHTGRPSIYATNFADEYDDLYRNDGNWSFTNVSYQSGVALPSLPWVKWGTAFADFDNDGWLDLIAVSGHVYPQVDSLPSGGGYRQPKLLHLNQTDGTFCDASNQAGPALQERRVSRGLDVGDLFKDGNVDVVIGDLDGAPMILRNRGVPGRNWVSFDLAGAKSNRMAIGARVKVVAGGMMQTDEVHSGGSYLSQNDTRLHFGLGSAKKIDRVEIRWPSGAVEKLDGLDVNKFYSVLEGSGVESRDVHHHKASRLTMSCSSLLRKGRGG